MKKNVRALVLLILLVCLSFAATTMFIETTRKSNQKLYQKSSINISVLLKNKYKHVSIRIDYGPYMIDTTIDFVRQNGRYLLTTFDDSKITGYKFNCFRLNEGERFVLPAPKDNKAPSLTIYAEHDKFVFIKFFEDNMKINLSERSVKIWNKNHSICKTLNNDFLYWQTNDGEVNIYSIL